MRSYPFKCFLLGVAAYAIATSIFLLIFLPALPGPIAVFLSWLLGGIITVVGGYGFILRRNGLAAAEPRLDHSGQPIESLFPQFDQAFAEITTSADLIGDIAGSTEAVLYQNDQAMRPIMSAVEKMAAGAAEQTQFTQETAGMAEELAATTISMASGAQTQGTSIAHANQLNQRVLEIVAAANQVAAAAQQAGIQTASDMDSIRTSVTTATEKTQAMSKRSNDIRVVLELLQDIAAQTRLLTVNAAIEAARAGEQGRGFAEVASEVRRLSESSNSSVAKIRKLVAEITQASRESMDAMDQIESSVSEGVRSVKHSAETLEEIGKAFRLIQTAVNELTTEIQAVSGVVKENTTATEQMAASSRQVKTAVEQVAGITRENQAAIAQINSSIAQISRLILDSTVSAQSLLDMSYSIQSTIAPLQAMQSQAHKNLMAAAVNRKAAKKLTLGLAMPYGLSRTFWKKMILFAEEAAKQLDTDLIVLDADGSSQRMEDNFQNLLKRGVDGILAVPYFENNDRLLAAAAQQSTPVIITDTYLRGIQPQIGPYPNYLAFVGPSNAGIGYRIADYMFQKQPDSRVAALMGPEGHISGIQRTKGLEYALRKTPSAHLVAKANSDFTREAAAKAMAEMMNAHPEINAVWAANDANALGAIDVIKRCGKVPGRDVLVVGMDLDEENISLVGKGEQLCSASVHWMQAGLGLLVMHDFLNGFNLSYQRAIIKLNLLFLTSDLVPAYDRNLSKDGLLPFDFKNHSQVYNPAAQLGRFDLTIL